MSKKQEKKKQQKIIEDRTFGLKNKNKSKAVQKYVKGVQQTVKNQGKSLSALESEEYERKKLKKKQEMQAQLIASMFKSVKQNNLQDQESSDQDADPKTKVCPYYKQGLCNKGKHCKYSHDLTLQKGKDMDLYIDQRTQLIMNGQTEEYFDQEKLLKLIQQKSKQYTRQVPTQIVCRYFIDAVEKKKYNWNWSCPNGMGCHYRHCLPPGYSLKLKQKKQGNGLAVQAEIDMIRQSMQTSKGTPVTLQRFLKWKQDKKLRRQQQELSNRKEEEKKYKHGKQHFLSGKALFEYDASIFVDDEQAVQDKQIYLQRVEQQEQKQQKAECLQETAQLGQEEQPQEEEEENVC